jgi:hypothetical protein
MSTLVDISGLGPRGFGIDGSLTGDRAGFAISSAGDVNGDGFADIIVGAPYSDLGSVNRGAAYVIYGRPGGFGEIDLSNVQPSQGFAIQGAADNFQTGLSVSSAGDVNGDGFDDLIVAATRRVSGPFGYGNVPQAYVIYGNASRTGPVDLTNFPSSDGFHIVGVPESTYYGVDRVSVSSAGDFNGDGFDDLLVGTPYARDNSGAAYVIWGKPSGLNGVDLGAFGPSQAFAILSSNSGDGLGRSVSSAGDINGDGFDDIIIGAPYNDAGGGEAGAVYVIFGKSSGFGSIDVAHLSLTDGFVIQGDAAFDNAGLSVSRAGDINHDGFDDILIGAPGNDIGGGQAGAAYVIFGKATGFGPIDLSSFGTAGFIIQGDVAGDSAGWSVSAAGDVNHDGIDDIIVGAPFSDAGAQEAGRAYIIFGRANTGGAVDLSNLDSAVGFIIADRVQSTFAGYSVSGAGDFNHDGFADVLVGAPFVNTSHGQVYVVSGNSTLADIDNDFNGDGRSDFLLRNDTGSVTDWLSQAGGSFAANTNFQVQATPDWHIIATGDFNGDGREDILWRSDAGVVTNWLGSANGGFSNNWTNFRIQADASWNVVGTGDFNGDGRDDILWRSSDGTVTNSLGMADGGFSSNSGNFTIDATADWQIIGTGDFNGDGRDDILWRSDAGTVTNWLGVANGALVTNYANFTIHADANWQIIGTGDFTGDGRQDILWKSDTGTVTDWLGTMTGGFTNNGSNFMIHADANWHVVGIGDFNGDLRDDLLWQNDAGQLSDWLGQVNGAITPNAQNFNFALGTQWHVQDAFL